LSKQIHSTIKSIGRSLDIGTTAREDEIVSEYKNGQRVKFRRRSD